MTREELANSTFTAVPLSNGALLVKAVVQLQNITWNAPMCGLDWLKNKNKNKKKLFNGSSFGFLHQPPTANLRDQDPD